MAIWANWQSEMNALTRKMLSGDRSLVSSLVIVIGLATLPIAQVIGAEPSPALSKVFSAQPAGEYMLDRTHASVVWRVAHMGLSRYTARFDKMDGKLDFRPGSAASSSVEFTIETASVNTGIVPFNRQLMDAEWFDGTKQPTIRFRSTGMEAVGGNRYRLSGGLTMRGVTKPVVWDVTFNGGLYNTFMQANAIGFSAKTTLKRSDWGMTKLIPLVGDEVEVEVEVEFLNRPTTG